MKKLKLFLMSLVLCLIFPFVVSASPSPSNAYQPMGPGEWDPVKGYDGELFTSKMFAEPVNRYKSYGGDFKLEFSNLDGTSNCFDLQLMEYDPNTSDDEIGAKREVCGRESVAEMVWNVRGAVDGGNGAELYLFYGNAEQYDSYIMISGYD